MMRNDSARVSLREMTETIFADPCLVPDRNQVAKSSHGNYTLYVSQHCTIYFEAHFFILYSRAPAYINTYKNEGI